MRPSAHKFTGDERDSETGLDHTWFRQYSSPLGRWMHPDPAGLAAVDPTDPQSWNRYAYASNSPLNYVDPSGLSDCPDMNPTCEDDWGDLCNGSPGVDLFGGGPGGACADGPIPKCPNGVGATQLCIDKWGNIAGSYNGEVYCNGPYCSTWDASSYSWIPCPPFSLCMNSAGDPSYFGGGGNTSDGQRIGPQPPPPPSTQPVTPSCMTAALLNNFFGSSGRFGTTVGVHVVAYAAVKYGTKRLAAMALPGPGWVYGGLAVTWDVINIAKSYSDCKQTGGLKPE